MIRSSHGVRGGGVALLVAFVSCTPRDEVAEHRQALQNEGAAFHQGLAVGGTHGCALRTDGKLYCWGQNTHGQLGIGSMVFPPAPPSVPAQSSLASGQSPIFPSGDLFRGSAIAELTAGRRHTCARASDGRVWCWGDNAGRQSNPTSTSTELTSPSRVTNPPITGTQHLWNYQDPSAYANDHIPGAYRRIVASTDHVCAITYDGRVRCWGRNDYCQGGVANQSSCTTNLSSRVITGQPEVVKVHGTGAALTNIVDVATGPDRSCALDVEGRVWCWGRIGGYASTDINGNAREVTGFASTPLDIEGGGTVDEGGIGGAAFCAMLSDGTVSCWGFGGNGQLGTNSNSTETPRAVTGLSEAQVAQITVGTTQTCARLASGEVRCWGMNGSGELGNGSTGWTPQTTPQTVLVVGGATLTGVSHVAAGAKGACAIRVLDGAVYCWGAEPVQANVSRSEGTAGAPQTSVAVAYTPDYPLNEGQSGFQSYLWSSVHAGPALEGGYAHNCAIVDAPTSATYTYQAGRRVFCWGANSYGQCGAGSTSTSTVPAMVSGLSDDVVSIAAGGDHSCALRANGTVACWGKNLSGQVGVATTTCTSCTTPQEVALPSGRHAIGISAGTNHVCAVLDDQRVVCWGGNVFGQSGGSGTSSSPNPTPQYVARAGGGDLRGVTRISCGAGHTCARLSNGEIHCWGNNASRQLRHDLTATSTHLAQGPVTLGGTVLRAVAVSAGDLHSCAVRADGAVYCWGDDSMRQRGDGSSTTAQDTEPTRVMEAVNVAMNGAVAVSGDRDTTCALLSSGRVRCWGYAIGGSEYLGACPFGACQLRRPLRRNTTEGTWVPDYTGIPNADGEAGPNHVVRMEDVVQSNVSYNTGCVMTVRGRVYCWGDNANNAVGSIYAPATCPVPYVVPLWNEPYTQPLSTP